MNVTTSQVLDVQRHIQENVQTLLTVHRSDITDEVTLAVLQGRVRRNGFECLQSRAVANNKDIILRVCRLA